VKRQFGGDQFFVPTADPVGERRYRADGYEAITTGKVARPSVTGES